jgi:5-methylcytosine-specific restriction endonuclease McrA
MIRLDSSKMREPEDIHTCDFKNFIRELLKAKEFKKSSTYFNPLSKRINEQNDKCGYCETKVNRAGFYLTIDHYRPKDKLRDDESHPGYYWLAYEWTNLVPACPKCNAKKSNCFPIEGKRVTGPPLTANGELDWNLCRVDSTIHLEEKPLMLHPVFDCSQDEIVFNRNGKIEGKTTKGKVTIEVCDLNRESLQLARKELVEEFYRKIKKKLLEIACKHEIIDKNILQEFEEIFNRIKQSGAPSQPYSRMGWTLFQKFEEFVIESLQKELGEKAGGFVRKAFEWFCR